MIILNKLLLFAIGAYRKFLSPYFPASCRFYPSCSCYAAESIHRYGAWWGMGRAIRRIVRCHPWHSGGFDPVD